MEEYKKITASQLEKGKGYIYGNGMYKMRIPVEFEGTHVYYREVCEYDDMAYGGYCTKTHFARVCPYEATEEQFGKMIEKALISNNI